jgi:hypothetical protein
MFLRCVLPALPDSQKLFRVETAYLRPALSIRPGLWLNPPREPSRVSENIRRGRRLAVARAGR